MSGDSNRPKVYVQDAHELRADETVFGLVRRALAEDVPKTFEAAWKDLMAGHPGRFAAKATGVGLGCVLTADGIYNIISGFDEEVNDLFVPNSTGRNNTRMFVGAIELVTGAGALYLGLTKGARVPLHV